MAITEPFTGSEAVTQATEWSTTTDTAGPDAQTDDGVYQLFLDFVNLVDGDVVRVRYYEKIDAVNQRSFDSVDVSNNQGATKGWASPSFILMHGWDFTLQMVTATTRTILWSIRKVA
jgi:hypothetical protein